MLIFKQGRMKLVRFFVLSAAILLFVTAAVKVISGLGSAPVLETSDPLFRVRYRILFLFIGVLEFGIAIFCFYGKRIALRVGLVAWIATSFLVYRASMSWVGYKRPCPCLGSLTGMLHITSQVADLAMKLILAYLLVGSYLALFWLWQQRRGIAAMVV